MALVSRQNKISVYGVQFEKWRIFQGLLINGVFITIGVVSLPERILIGLYTAYCMFTFTVLYVLQYRKSKNSRKAIIISLFRFVCLPSTTIV